jgi:hypothetical protein
VTIAVFPTGHFVYLIAAHRIGSSCIRCGAILNEARNLSDSDFDKLSRLKALSWLSAAELGSLAGALAVADY